MHTKLTLSLDKSVIERAKRYAREHQVSLSSLVETLLRRSLPEPADRGARSGSIVRELSGIIRLEGETEQASYQRYLEEKHR
jgi:hypothetical protein